MLRRIVSLLAAGAAYAALSPSAVARSPEPGNEQPLRRPQPKTG
jgi:hypothetical protein